MTLEAPKKKMENPPAPEALKRAWENFERCQTILTSNRTELAERFVVAGMRGVLAREMRGASAADARCVPRVKVEPPPPKPWNKAAPAATCGRNDAYMMLLRKAGGLSGCVPGMLPAECGL